MYWWGWQKKAALASAEAWFIGVLVQGCTSHEATAAQWLFSLAEPGLPAHLHGPKSNETVVLLS